MHLNLVCTTVLHVLCKRFCLIVLISTTFLRASFWFWEFRSAARKQLEQDWRREAGWSVRTGMDVWHVWITQSVWPRYCWCYLNHYIFWNDGENQMGFLQGADNGCTTFSASFPLFSAGFDLFWTYFIQFSKTFHWQACGCSVDMRDWEWVTEAKDSHSSVGLWD